MSHGNFKYSLQQFKSSFGETFETRRKLKMLQKLGKFLFRVNFNGFFSASINRSVQAMLARDVVQIVTCLHWYFSGFQHFYQIRRLTFFNSFVWSFILAKYVVTPTPFFQSKCFSTCTCRQASRSWRAPSSLAFTNGKHQINLKLRGYFYW